MSVLVRHVMPHMTREDYEKHSPTILAKAQNEEGFILHVGFPVPDGPGWAVSEIWETEQQSQANFDKNVKPNVPDEQLMQDATHQVIQDINLVAAKSLVSH